MVYRENSIAKDFIAAHSCPSLSEADKKEIDSYWATYHVRFQNYDWHRMYYAVTGIHDPRFLPQPFTELVLYPFYNRLDFVGAYADKNMFSSILPRMQFPECIGSKINSCYFDADGHYLGDSVTDAVVDSLFAAFSEKSRSGSHDIIVKESIGSYMGLGVQKVRILSKDDLRDFLVNHKSENVILQTVIRQHPFFSQFNQDSVNIMRLTTWQNHGSVHVFSPCVRFGIPGSHTDVALRNGVEIVNAAGISTDGTVEDLYWTLEGEKKPLQHLSSKKVPCWNEVIQCITAGALQMPHFRVIGWDITVNDQNQVICIEYNLKTPGTVSYQFAHGPFAGEHTDDYLAFLKEENNIHLIPGCIRLK